MYVYLCTAIHIGGKDVAMESETTTCDTDRVQNVYSSLWYTGCSNNGVNGRLSSVLRRAQYKTDL